MIFNLNIVDLILLLHHERGMNFVALNLGKFERI